MNVEEAKLFTRQAIATADIDEYVSVIDALIMAAAEAGEDGIVNPLDGHVNTPNKAQRIAIRRHYIDQGFSWRTTRQDKTLTVLYWRD